MIRLSKPVRFMSWFSKWATFLSYCERICNFFSSMLKKRDQQLKLSLFALHNHECFMFASLNEITLCCIEHSEPVFLALFLKLFLSPEFQEPKLQNINCGIKLFQTFLQW